MSVSFLLIYCTVPDEAIATAITDALLEHKLVACVQHSAGLTSHYLWQGQRCQAAELLLSMKAPSDNFERVCQTICRIHPYEIPEIIAVPLQSLLPSYAAWLEKECSVE